MTERQGKTEEHLPRSLSEQFVQFPIQAEGNWSKNQIVFNLRWDGRYSQPIPGQIKPQVRDSYLSYWRPKLEKIKPQLDATREATKDLPPAERKQRRQKIIPYPGVLMTFEDIEQAENQVVVSGRVGNYFALRMTLQG